MLGSLGIQGNDVLIHVGSCLGKLCELEKGCGIIT
jgi:hypothetical protein